MDSFLEKNYIGPREKGLYQYKGKVQGLISSIGDLVTAFSREKVSDAPELVAKLNKAKDIIQDVLGDLNS